MTNYLNNQVTMNVTIYKSWLRKMKLTLLRENKALREVLLALSVVLGFIFIVSFSTLYVSDAIRNNNACGCVIPIPYMILLLSSLGLFVGSVSFYILTSKYLKEKQEITKGMDITLSFLDGGERRIVDTLIKQKQGLKQSRLAKLTGMHKVKVHRLLRRLESKGIIIKSSKDRSKLIELRPELRELFH